MNDRLVGDYHRWLLGCWTGCWTFIITYRMHDILHEANIFLNQCVYFCPSLKFFTILWSYNSFFIQFIFLSPYRFCSWTKLTFSRRKSCTLGGTWDFTFLVIKVEKTLKIQLYKMFCFYFTVLYLSFADLNKFLCMYFWECIQYLGLAHCRASECAKFPKQLLRLFIFRSFLL